MPRRGTLTSDRSKIMLAMANSDPTKPDMHTQRKVTGDGHSDKKQKEPNKELALLADSRKKGIASRSLPDLMQRGIHM